MKFKIEAASNNIKQYNLNISEETQLVKITSSVMSYHITDINLERAKDYMLNALHRLPKGIENILFVAYDEKNLAIKEVDTIADLNKLPFPLCGGDCSHWGIQYETQCAHYTIELSSLEDLLELSKVCGHDVIVSFNSRWTNSDLTIYDSEL